MNESLELVLFFISLSVYAGSLAKKNMWPLIVFYWFTLTIRNTQFLVHSIDGPILFYFFIFILCALVGYILGCRKSS